MEKLYEHVFCRTTFFIITQLYEQINKIEIKNKTEDLVNLAVEKGTPVLEKAADEVRERAILVTKEVLKKLEKEETK